jgi:hypothetical protein
MLTTRQFLSAICVVLLIHYEILAVQSFQNKTLSPLSKFVAALSKPGAFAKEVRNFKYRVYRGAH